MVSLRMSENIKDIFLVAANILTGKCETDTFQVKIDVEWEDLTDICQGIQAQTGSDTPLICGYNTGQHLYLDAGAYTSSEASVKSDLT